MKIELYVPTRKSDGSSIVVESRQEWLERAARLMSALFGGCTVVEGVGYWVESSGALVRESVSIVYSYSANIRKETSEVRQFCIRMRVGLVQESVLLVVDGVPDFVV